MNDTYHTVPELYFFKYKGIPSPWEILEKAKHIGFKCKKYANWPAVHVSEDSRQILKTVGDSLIDDMVFEIENYSELSKIWERIQRWTKDRDNLSLEPDILTEYENLSRMIITGSTTPDVVDLILEEFGFNLEAIELENRWLVFLSLTIYNFVHTSKKYNKILALVPLLDENKTDPVIFVDRISRLLIELYLLLGFDISKEKSEDIICLFIREIGFSTDPVSVKRNSSAKIKTLPKVWIDKYDGPQTEIVKFEYSEGNIFVKINRANKIFLRESEVGKLLLNEAYWTLIGKSLESHIGQIDEIQDFYNTFARHLRNTV